MEESVKIEKLGNIVDVKGGKRLPKGISLISTPNNHPYIRIRDLGASKILELNSAYEYVDDETQKTIARYIVSSGDILISIVGTIGLVGIVGDSLHGANQTENCVKLVNLKGIDRDYLYYFLSSNLGQNEIKRGIVGAVQSKLPIKNIENINIPLPSLALQKSIASILSSLDSKIELNRRINDNLEQQAQAMFKSWFVENASYSGVSISEYFLPNRGKNLLVSDAKGGITPVVAGGLTPSAFHNVANTKAPVITISASGANAGFVNLWGIPVWAADSSYIDSTIVSNIYFWYNLLKYNQKNIYESQTGSAQPHIYPKHIGNLLIPDLDMRKVECYESIVTSMYLQINEIQQETKFLSDLRDTLLPKLMSGELKINDLNC